MSCYTSFSFGDTPSSNLFNLMLLCASSADNSFRVGDWDVIARVCTPGVHEQSRRAVWVDANGKKYGGWAERRGFFLGRFEKKKV
jgi:hypothetical protein